LSEWRADGSGQHGFVVRSSPQEDSSFPLGDKDDGWPAVVDSADMAGFAANADAEFTAKTT
jgi:hypothetical protein